MRIKKDPRDGSGGVTVPPLGPVGRRESERSKREKLGKELQSLSRSGFSDVTQERGLLQDSKVETVSVAVQETV